MQRFVPRKAFILAAGYGARMAPLSFHTPKPAMPLWGSPIIARVLGMLADWGVKEAMVNLHHKPRAVIKCLKAGAPAGMTISFSHEPEILGTGGALRRASAFSGGDPFWIMNADVAADLDPAPLLKAFYDRRLLAALWMEPGLGPRSVLARRGLVRDFSAGRQGRCGLTFCGLHLASPALLRFMPRSGFYSVIAAYENAIKAGCRVGAVCVEDAFWRDLGTPEAYVEAHAAAREKFLAGRQGGGLYSPAADAAKRLAENGVSTDGFVAAGENVVVERGAFLRNAVLWDGARVLAGAKVCDAVVCSGATVRGAAQRAAVTASAFPRSCGCGETYPRVRRLLERMRWPLRETTAVCMAPRGSDRVFTRLRRGRAGVIAITYGAARPENELYARNAVFLKTLGVRAPDIIFFVPRLRALAVEDLGDECLLDAVLRGLPRRSLEELYRRTLDMALIMHVRGAVEARRRRLPLAPAFSADVFRWERELFARHFLAGVLGLAPRRTGRIMQELEYAAAELEQAPPALVHRDLQATNVMLTQAGPALIDFQGMRFGPAMYDVASLLYDPYVEPAPELQEKLLAYYLRRSGEDAARGRHLFRVAAVQRLAQALGAFGRLAALPETGRFAAHYPAGLRMLRRAVSGLAEKLPCLSALLEKKDFRPSRTAPPYAFPCGRRKQ